MKEKQKSLLFYFHHVHMYINMHGMLLTGPRLLLVVLCQADSHPILLFFHLFPAISQTNEGNRESDFSPSFPLLTLSMPLSAELIKHRMKVFIGQ